MGKTSKLGYHCLPPPTPHTSWYVWVYTFIFPEINAYLGRFTVFSSSNKKNSSLMDRPKLRRKGQKKLTHLFLDNLFEFNIFTVTFYALEGSGGFWRETVTLYVHM